MPGKNDERKRARVAGEDSPLRSPALTLTLRDLACLQRLGAWPPPASASVRSSAPPSLSGGELISYILLQQSFQLIPAIFHSQPI